MNDVTVAAPVVERAAARGAWRRAWDSDFAWSFRHSPVAVVSAIVFALLLGGAVLAPWVAPHDPFDLRTLNLLDSMKPPVWAPDGVRTYLLGTDDQ